LPRLANHESPYAAAASRIGALYEEFVRQSPVAAAYFTKLRKLFDQQPHRISAEISPNDAMFVPEWREHYVGVGLEALRAIKLAMLAGNKSRIGSILDLPCGHGRVMRVLRSAFPDARITACDIDRDAVDFCAQTFGATPVYSHEDPDRIPVYDRFDLVWCGSLLTHVDAFAWPRFLRFFNQCVAPGGLFVFTVHGRESVQWVREGKCNYSLADVPAILNEYDRDGFGFQVYPAHPLPGYGISLSSPSWVANQVIEMTDLRLVLYLESGWDNHQDVVICQRP
jgi:SAM-dependent methyltransferase